MAPVENRTYMAKRKKRQTTNNMMATERKTKRDELMCSRIISSSCSTNVNGNVVYV